MAARVAEVAAAEAVRAQAARQVNETGPIRGFAADVGLRRPTSESARKSWETRRRRTAAEGSKILIGRASG